MVAKTFNRIVAWTHVQQDCSWTGGRPHRRTVSTEGQVGAQVNLGCRCLVVVFAGLAHGLLNTL